MRKIEALWAQYYESSGVALDAIDVFIHHVGKAAVISQACYQKDVDGKWVASVRYWQEAA